MFTRGDGDWRRSLRARSWFLTPSENARGTEPFWGLKLHRRTPMMATPKGYFPLGLTASDPSSAGRTWFLFGATAIDDVHQYSDRKPLFPCIAGQVLVLLLIAYYCTSSRKGTEKLHGMTQSATPLEQTHH
jgi:hypothetical protein